ncbi:XdhC family protein [Streptomyces albidoflavus]|uniref:XdhC family protein n=1 Tax=Streptomyces koyangensis TaxID=188770 RepID=UPI0036EF99C3
MQINGSAPLPLGTALAVDADGNAVGSVSGRSVDDALAVGLTCDGELDILLQRIVPTHQPPPHRDSRRDGIRPTHRPASPATTARTTGPRRSGQ